MSPLVRRALHQALDIVLDALAAEQEAKSLPKRRGPVGPRLDPLDPSSLPPELRAQLDRHMARTGYKKAG